MPNGSQRLAAISESATIAMNDRVKQLNLEGVEVIDLAGGDPDFATPSHVVDGAKQALDGGMTHYSASRGIPELRRAVQRDLFERTGVEYRADSQIIVTPSAKHALYIAFLAAIDPGDEVLILCPTWVSHSAIVQLVGGLPVPIIVDGVGGPEITQELLSAHVRHRTKAILISSPSNPTGRVLTRPELEAVVRVAESHDLLIVSDEIYSRIVYDGRKAESIAGVASAASRALVVNGFSKTYAMTGWRLGYLVGPPTLMNAALKAQQHTVGCAATFTQIAGMRALAGPQESVTEMVRVYTTRRDRILPELNALPGVECRAPAGAFYAWADIRGTARPGSVDFSEWLLDSARVAVVPGAAFGPGGEGHVRLSFAVPDSTITAAIESMRRAFAS